MWRDWRRLRAGTYVINAQPIGHAGQCCVVKRRDKLRAGGSSWRAAMAAMLTCGEFRNGKRVASLTKACGTHLQRKSWEGARENTVFVRRVRDRGIKEMRAFHRHPARTATLLPKESSLYDAIRSIIGVELRSKSDAPKSLPSYLDDLLKELDDRLGSDQVQGSTHSERPTNRASPHASSEVHAVGGSNFFTGAGRNRLQFGAPRRRRV